MTQNVFDRWQIVTAACVISAVGASFYNILPIFVGSLQDTMQLSHTRIGFIPSAFYLGFGMIAATAYFWIRKVNWRYLGIVAIIASVLALVLLAMSTSYATLITAIILVGICFGILYSLGSTILGDSGNPARYFGIKIGIEMIIGVVLLFSLPVLVIQRWGFSGVIISLIIVVIVLGGTVLWIPVKGLKGVHNTTENAEYKPGSVLPIWSSLFALVFFFGGMTSVWTFVERMAMVANIPPATIGKILAASLLIGIVGAVGAAFLGKRIGTILPLIVGLFFCVIADISLALDITELSYLLSTSVFGIAFAFTIPFMLSLLSDLDYNGQFIVLSVPAISIGIIVFPSISGLLIAEQSYLGVNIFAAVFIAIAGLLAGVASRGVTGVGKI